MAAVEITEDDVVLYLRLDLLTHLNGDMMKKWAKKALKSSSHLVTGGYISGLGLLILLANHLTLKKIKEN